ncbi:MAG: dihydroorotase [Phycisphaerales bacterium]|nr:dihydroorotase [Phycisphaerales bacterium]
MARILIVNGRLLDPVSGLDTHADLAIDQGRIVEMGPKLSRLPADEIIDAEGCLVTPGLIDPHVHLREPGNERAETIASGTRAAVEGGFTTVCCMPNTTPALDNDAMVHFVRARTETTGSCRVFPVCAISKGRKGDELAEIALMARAGASGFSDDGDCVASAGLMSRALATVKPTGKAIMQHCQEPTMTRGGVMHAGIVSTRLDLGGWPRAAEEIIIDRDVRLNRNIGCKYHVQHISSGESVNIIRRARAEGQPVSGEATPHHLLLTCDLIETSGYDPRYKMNPPLREKSDIEAIKHGIADKTITVLGTDHAPHPAETKEVPFDSASFGLVGLETAVPLYAEALVHGNVIDWPRMIAMMTIEPARLCGLDAMGLGMLKVGGPADVTVIDPDAEWTVTRKTLAGQSFNTPFMGRSVRGRAVAVVVAGQIKLARTRGLAFAQA